MKFGFRTPSFKKSLSARASIKRKFKPRMPKGFGVIRNPQKALYNKVYNKTTTSFGKGCAVYSIVVMVVLIMLLGCNSASETKDTNYAPKPEVQKKINPEFVTTATSLTKEFEDNEFKYERKYLGKVIQVEGTVSHIGSQAGQPYINLKGAGMVWDLVCFCEEVDQVARLSTGQKILVIGIGSENTLGPTMIKCILYNP